MLQCLEKGTLQNQIFADPGQHDEPAATGPKRSKR
jgi:hypothetical protein